MRRLPQGGKIVLRMGAQPNEKFGAAVETGGRRLREARRAGRPVQASWVGVPRAGADAGFPFEYQTCGIRRQHENGH